ncbi:GAF and ANTAR domain-containing protein [Streptomyces sp. NPDC051452]|uniref:GAF and ANTAR domain-containing protein n=1 Tax=Streptomyces sp. NPDC051452 TaxID=3365654 RepID=UPI0037B1CB73
MSREESGSHTPSPRETAADPGGVRHLRNDNLALRNRLHAHSPVSAAQGILKERYRLTSLDTGFELLRRSSQQHNIKLHTLADAVIRVPGPDRHATAWFPRRARTSPPPLTEIRPPDQSGFTATQGSVLGAGLKRVLSIAETTMGNAQLVERGLLRLEKHTGLDRQFTDFFAFVDDSTTACAQAAKDRQQITVRDVATAAVFDPESRRVILRAGSRACHSVPVVDDRGALLGVISTHHSRPLSDDFTPVQRDALHSAATTVGRWLSWHRHTVVLDALEHLHSTARQAH